MKHEGVLDLVSQCNLEDGDELVCGKAFLFNQKFCMRHASGDFYYEEAELIVLVKNSVKVGGIYRMGSYDLHWVMKKQYQGQHILSNFLKTGTIKKIWPENTYVTLEMDHSRKEYNKKKYLVHLCGLTVRNEDEIEEYLKYFKQ